MEDKKNIKLTDDPLTNIYIMTPFLDDRAREAVSYLMYGCCLGEKLADKKESGSSVVLEKSIT